MQQSVAIAVLFRVSKQKQKIKTEKSFKEKKQLELKSIRSQLNPHFVFNALGSIQGLINKNDAAKANDYLTEFSSLLRESLKNSDAELVPLSTEIKILETYIRLEQLRFHFNYSLIVSKDLPGDTIEIPSLLIQPLVENAVKHGIAPLHENGNLNIYFSRKNNNLLIDISDNGKGFDNSLFTSGFGLKLTRERIGLLNQSLSNGTIQLTIESNTPSGTMAQVVFENWL